MVLVDRCLIFPLIDQKYSFRIIHRDIILIAKISFLRADLIRCPALLHLLCKFSRIPVYAFVTKIYNDAHTTPLSPVQIDFSTVPAARQGY